MAILKPGQVGNFNGKIGQVVVSTWRQLTVGRSTPKKSSKKATETQLDQQSKFGLVTTFVSRFISIISLGYQNSQGNLTPYNRAVKYLLNTAVIGAYPDYAIDFSKFLLSSPRASNEIDTPESITMSATVSGKITLTWVSKLGSLDNTKDTDKLYTLFYNASDGSAMLTYGDVERSKLSFTTRVPEEESTDQIHGWAVFISANKKLVSKTMYLGIVGL